jgi:hypothetical protein
MKRKSFVAAVIACGIGMMASASLADSLYVGTVLLTQSAYSSGYGGEFTGQITASNTPVPPELSGLAPTPGGTLAPQASNVALNSSSFQTFCIQQGNHDVTFSPGSTYYGITTVSPIGAPTLNADAAVLFDLFWNGNSALGYNFSNSGGTRAESAGALQDAIWVLEGDDGTINNSSTSTDIDNAVIAASGASVPGAGINGDSAAITQAETWVTNALNGTYNGDVSGNTVEVLQMYGPVDGISPAQNQLVEVPGTSNGPNSVPLPASANMGILLLAGFGGFSVLRKLMKQNPRIA